MPAYDTALIDGDIVVYRAGHAVEDIFYTNSDGTFFTTSKSEAGPNAHRIVAAPHYKLVCKYVDRTIAGILQELGVSKYKIFLTSMDMNVNYRKKINNGYKANRIGKDKPQCFTMIRDYLCSKYNAIVVDGIEADDALGLAQRDTTCIASIDKDLMQIPGHHYNISTKESVHVTDPGAIRLSENKKKIIGYGEKFLLAQMITGDVVDNIKGIKGKGPVAAYNLLKDIKDIEEGWIEVEVLYHKQHMSNRTFLDNIKLLRICRNDDDVDALKFAATGKGD